MQKPNNVMLCQHCGAPITSEVCHYCGALTGLDVEQVNMDYPVLECKEASLSFWNVAFPAIFAVSFGISGCVVPIGMYQSGLGLSSILICLPFLLIGLVATIVVIRSLTRYIKIKVYGKRITATVYGYMDDNVLINGSPAQIIKLLVQTAEGPRFIMYQTGSTKRIYGANTQVNLLVYKNYFMIAKKQDSVDWV